MKDWTWRTSSPPSWGGPGRTDLDLDLDPDPRPRRRRPGRPPSKTGRLELSRTTGAHLGWSGRGTGRATVPGGPARGDQLVDLGGDRSGGGNGWDLWDLYSPTGSLGPTRPRTGRPTQHVSVQRCGLLAGADLSRAGEHEVGDRSPAGGLYGRGRPQPPLPFPLSRKTRPTNWPTGVDLHGRADLLVSPPPLSAVEQLAGWRPGLPLPSLPRTSTSTGRAPSPGRPRRTTGGRPARDPLPSLPTEPGRPTGSPGRKEGGEVAVTAPALPPVLPTPPNSDPTTNWPAA